MINKPIAVLAHFLPDGKVRPIRFKIEGEDGEQVINIEGFMIKANNNIRTEFTCNITLNGIRRRCEIWYFKQEVRWILYDLK